jgi:predicted RNA binding protein YcfA (HicA-like mRNA interferase family)
MKYSELEKKIEETTSCRLYRNGGNHPIWINPETGEFFAMSHHRSEEVKQGTLKSIIKKSGVKL